MLSYTQMRVADEVVGDVHGCTNVARAQGCAKRPDRVNHNRTDSMSVRSVMTILSGTKLGNRKIARSVRYKDVLHQRETK